MAGERKMIREEECVQSLREHCSSDRDLTKAAVDALVIPYLIGLAADGQTATRKQELIEKFWQSASPSRRRTKIRSLLEA
jgi:hypothetical protein